jgi:hypothetical protein
MFWILNRDPANPSEFLQWTSWELDILDRIVPFLGRSAISPLLYRHGDNIKAVLDGLKARLASKGKGLKEVLELKFSPGAVQEILDFHAKTNISNS